MFYDPTAISVQASSIVPFSNHAPTDTIWVSTLGSDANSGSAASPFKTIQAAVKFAKPGTVVMVKEGVYTENVELRSLGATPDKPIWVVSADGPGAASIVSPTASKPVIVGYGVSNLVIKGFELVGGTEGIKLTQSGNDLTRLVSNVVIEQNDIHGQSVDGIKTAQTINTAIVGNSVHDVKTQEAIDNVYMRNGLIANNEIYDIRGLSGIVVKAGSENIKILDNYLHQVPDGILVGGFSSGQGSIFPTGITYEAKNILVQGNTVVGASKHGLNAYGAVDSVIKENSLINNSTVSVINVGTDNLGYVSKGVQLIDNLVGKTYWLTSSAQSVSFASGNSTKTVYENSHLGPDAVDTIPVDPLMRTWIESGAATLTIKGTAVADVLTGTTGNDFIDGSAGIDRMSGGNGDDTYVVGSRLDVVVEKLGDGTDTIHLWDISYTLPAETEVLIVKTAVGARITDNALSNILVGGAGKDTLVFTAGHGQDLVKGFQVGEDHLVFSTPVALGDIKVLQTAGGDMILRDGTNSITLVGVDAHTDLASLF